MLINFNILFNLFFNLKKNKKILNLYFINKKKL